MEDAGPPLPDNNSPQLLSSDPLPPTTGEEPLHENLRGASSEEEEDNKSLEEQQVLNEDNAADSSSSSSSEDDDDESDNSHDVPKTEAIMIGGEIDTPAFALLAGMEDSKDGEREGKLLSIPLTRLPATLGRAQLGSRKALSRRQFAIYFQNAVGGKVEQQEEDSEAMTYRQPPPNYKDSIIRRNKDGPLPSNGFFVLESLGKNNMVVDDQEVEQGEIALLEHGSTIRVNVLSLYFLLPSNATDSRTIELAPKTTHAAEVNKRKAPSAATNTKPVKKPKGSAGVAAELEAMPVETLLSRMSEAIESNQWERKHQMIGSAISLHAVKDAARSKEIRKMAKQDAGNCVARSDIMSWIRENPTYTSWVSQMLDKMEIKSYQSNVSKALLKAGYVRTGTTGRHVKWILPEVEISDEDESSSDEEEQKSDSGSQHGDNVDEEDGAGSSSDQSKEEGSSPPHAQDNVNEETKEVTKEESSVSSSAPSNDENSDGSQEEEI